MQRPPLPDKVTDFLAKPNPAVITTIRTDGQPVSVATWYLLDDDQPVQGRVVQMRSDPDLHDIDRLCQRYTSDRFSSRERGRVSAWIAIDRWHAWEINDDS